MELEDWLFVGSVAAFAFLILFFIVIKYNQEEKGSFAIEILFNGVSVSSIFHYKTKIIMVKFKDVDAKGKHIILKFTVAEDAAGNKPTLVAGSFKAESSNENVAVAEVGQIDEENGIYPVRVTFPGKNGSADIKVTASGDLDNSGDAPFEYILSAVIETEEATGFAEPEISELSIDRGTPEDGTPA